MRTAMRPRYYCDHCNKGSGNPCAMRRHERGCTLNPQRVCGMCAKLHADGGPAPAPPRDELVKIMDSQGFTAMCETANRCPACILAALRTKNGLDPETGPYVAGPEDGRESWNYTKAKAEYWSNHNDAQAERNYPGY